MEIYSQLPYYDEFQGYGLGDESFLGQIAQKIYANFHMPSRRKLKRHLLMAKIQKKLFRDLKNIDGGGGGGPDKMTVSNKKGRSEGRLKSLFLILLMNW